MNPLSTGTSNRELQPIYEQEIATNYGKKQKRRKTNMEKIIEEVNKKGDKNKTFTIKKHQSDPTDIRKEHIRKNTFPSKEHIKIKAPSTGEHVKIRRATNKKDIKKFKINPQRVKSVQIASSTFGDLSSNKTKTRKTSSRSLTTKKKQSYENPLKASDTKHKIQIEQVKFSEQNFQDSSSSTQDPTPVQPLEIPKCYTAKDEIRKLITTMENPTENEKKSSQSRITTPRNLLFAYKKITDTETLLNCCLETLQSNSASNKQKETILKFCTQWLKSGLYKTERNQDEVSGILEAIENYTEIFEAHLAKTVTTRFKKALKKTIRRTLNPPLPFIYLELPIDQLKSTSKAKQQIDIVAEHISESYGNTLKNISFEDLIFWDPKLKEGAIQKAIEYNEEFQAYLIHSFSGLKDKEKAKLAYSYLLIGEKLIEKRDYHSACSLLSALNDFDNKQKIYEGINKTSKSYTALQEILDEASKISAQMVMPKFKKKIKKRKKNGEPVLSPLFFVTQQLVQSEEIPKYHTNNEINTSYLKAYTKIVSTFIEEVKNFY